MKHRKVIAIGLDAADPELLERWMSQGHLDNLRKLRDRGVYGRLANINYYKAETPWTTFLTGCLPEKTGYWSPIRFLEGTYDIEDVEAYDFAEHPPFYALGKKYRVAIFDAPQSRLVENVNGVQVMAWGAHSPQTPSCSEPAGVLEAIERRYGKHPAFQKDNGDWWDRAFLNRLYHSLLAGIRQRVDICQHLLQQEPWDLFLTVFSETHSASHALWHMSQSNHPLYGRRNDMLAPEDPMLDVFEATDRALGDLLDCVPDDAHVVVFSVHGCGGNTADITSMLCLPEFLYRFSFPGQMMLAPGKPETEIPEPIATSKRKSWIVDIWEHRHIANAFERRLRQVLPVVLHRYVDTLFSFRDHRLISPRVLRRQHKPQYWQPSVWYERLWPTMRAFALPSYSEGCIRINLQGREPNGIVTPETYESLCDELTLQLHQLVNPRTGNPVVKRVRRTRQSASDRRSNLPDADLIIEWEDSPTDVIDHPSLGRFGPVIYSRTGSHRARGFVFVSGPDIEPGATVVDGRGVDLAPTILELMGAPIPEYFDGRSFIQTVRTPR